MTIWHISSPLRPWNAAAWKFLRLRPQNFPHVRIAQLTQLYYNQTAGSPDYWKPGHWKNCTTCSPRMPPPIGSHTILSDAQATKCQGPDGRFIEPYRYQYRRPAAICLRTNPRQRQILRTGFAILRANQSGKQLYHTPMGRMRHQSGQRVGFASAHPTEKRVLRPEILSALPLWL